MPNDTPQTGSKPDEVHNQAGTEMESLDPTRHGEATREFEAFLRRRIIGQDAAIEAMSDIYQTFLVRMNPPGRPIANMLFLGPTGSGKTYVVEVVAEALSGNAKAFIKVNCAEFQEEHEIAKLIGSPPGYVGHGQTKPLITQQALEQWYKPGLAPSLVLFDEIEKASGALWQLLLGILDKATLTLGDNTEVDLSHAAICMTSNLGASEMTEMIQGGIGFVAGPTVVDESLDEKINRTALEAARKKFSPEFINRIDKLVVFKTLRPEHLEQILELELAKVQQRITNAVEQQHFTFECSPEAKRWLLQEGTDPRYGARHLKRVIEHNIVYALANLIASQQVVTGDHVSIVVDDKGKLKFRKSVMVGKTALASAEKKA